MTIAWPVSSNTSRSTASDWDSPGSTPPPGSGHVPGASVYVEFTVPRIPRSEVTSA